MDHRNSILLSTPIKIEACLSLPPDDRSFQEGEDIEEVKTWFQSASTLFEDITVEQLSNVLKHLTLFVYKPDNVIVHQGEEGSNLFVILRGCTSVYAKETHDRDKGVIEPVLPDLTVVRGSKERARFGIELCTLFPGQCFGELSVITNRERNASVIANETVVLIKVERDIYLKHIQEGAQNELLRRTIYVATHPIFRMWNPRYRDIIAESLQLKHYKFGEVIFKEGGKAETVYFVLEGIIKITLNPSADLGEYAKLLDKVERQESDVELPKEKQYLDPFKNLTIIERRKLRREKGYNASEKRYREMSICVVGYQGTVGDIEATLNLPTYTAKATCTESLTVYEMKKLDFNRLVLDKNKETRERIRSSIHEKLHYRNRVCENGLPIYNALLTYFQKPKPKDSRQKIMKIHKAKSQSKKVVTNEFFSEMSKGRTNNRPKTREVY